MVNEVQETWHVCCDRYFEVVKRCLCLFEYNVHESSVQRMVLSYKTTFYNTFSNQCIHKLYTPMNSFNKLKTYNKLADFCFYFFEALIEKPGLHFCL